MPGVSVSQVARRYDANANLVFTWLRDARFRSEEEAVTGNEVGFLPVEIVEDDRDGPSSASIAADGAAAGDGASGLIEIDLASGHRLRVSGAYDADALSRLIRALSA